MTSLFLIAFLLMSVQTLMGIVQIKAYQKEVNALKGTGLLGIGFRRATFDQGEIIILSYNRATQKIYKCRQLKGRTIFQKFKDLKEYEGMSLDEVRTIAISLDAVINKRLRKKEIYNSSKLDKKKGALIQAVEAIDNRIQKESAEQLSKAV